MRAAAVLLILLAAGCSKQEYAQGSAASQQVAAREAAAQPVRRSGIIVESLDYFAGSEVFHISNPTTGAECYGTTNTIHCNFPTKP